MIEFNAHITKGNKVQLPEWLVESANLKEGDVLRLAVLHKVIVEMQEQTEKKPRPKPKPKPKTTTSTD